MSLLMNKPRDTYEALPPVCQKIIDLDGDIERIVTKSILSFEEVKAVRAYVKDRAECIKVCDQKWGRKTRQDGGTSPGLA
jgi:hypothetical protein